MSDAMSDYHRNPPRGLANARVLEYAFLDQRVQYSGHSYLYVDQKELGPVPCIAICQELNDRCVLLIHCDREWAVLGFAEYPSVSEARKRAEKIYPGLAKCWVEADVTEPDAAIHAAEGSAQQCTFCGKGPLEVNRFIEKGGKFICDTCVTEFWQTLYANTNNNPK